MCTLYTLRPRHCTEKSTFFLCHEWASPAICRCNCTWHNHYTTETVRKGSQNLLVQKKEPSNAHNLFIIVKGNVTREIFSENGR